LKENREKQLTGLFLSFILAFQCSCQSVKEIQDSVAGDGSNCSKSLERVKDKTDIGALGLLRRMYFNGCYSQVIEAVNFVRGKFRDEIVSVGKDSAELFLYDGTIGDYRMEAYERIYLSLYAVRSYMELKKKDDARVELRRAYDEGVAQIESGGQDGITLFIMATLWEQLGERETALPLYRRILEIKNAGESLKYLARQKLKKPGAMFIYELGSMPDFDVDEFGHAEFKYPLAVQLVDKKIEHSYQKNMIKDCVQAEAAIISTDEWISILKERIRNPQSTKHEVKKVLRYPLTLLYTIGVFATGLYLTALVASQDLRGAVFIVPTVSLTARTYQRGVAPDVRIWKDLPQAWVISDKEVVPKKLKCLSEYDQEPWLNPSRFL
jgi:tetratricopeptide (TPR) repeat protein